MTNYINALDNPTNPYHREATRLADEIRDPVTATLVDGVLRWVSNGRVPPQDIVALGLHLGMAIDEGKCDAGRSVDLSTFLKGYNPVVTDEQRHEMRANFGPGATVVNVLTGRKVTL